MFENEQVVETKTCKHCNISFEITEKDLEFYEKISPIFDGKKYLIPSPNICSDCREQRRFSFRNERKIYRRKCDFCNKDIISIYSPDKKFKVFCSECWWSDKWSPLDYGIDFDFSKPFFEQYNNLFINVPKVAIQNAKSINSEFTNYSANNKNCYMIVGAGGCENSYFGYRIFNSKNIVDVYDLSDCEICYECMESEKIYNCFFCRGCINSSDLFLCEYSKNCSNCFCCINLIGKKYFIFNKEYSKEEYFEKIEEMLNNKEKYFAEFQNFKLKFPYKSLSLLNNENVVGNQLANCKNCFSCFTFRNSLDCKYSCFGENNKDSQDINFGDNGELQYFGTNLEENYKFAFGFLVWYVKNGYYLSNCMGGEYLFGCTGIKNSKYCILNKQYSKEGYEKLVPKIIEHMMKVPLNKGESDEGAGGFEWGEFFPSSISPFGYNETVANEYFPIESPQSQPFSQREKGVEQDSSFPLKGGGLRGSFNWSFYEAPFPKVEKIITVEMYNNTSLLEDISKIPDDVLNRAIECEVSKKPFRIIKQELEFYRKHNLPIPRKHPDQRHLERMALKNPRKLFDRKCDKCGQNIKTTYSPKRPEIIYCENCYEKEVY